MNERTTEASISRCPAFGNEELLAAVAGELPEPRAEVLAEHLGSCWDCHSQFDRLMQLHLSRKSTEDQKDDPDRARLESLLERIKVSPLNLEDFEPGDLIGRYKVIAKIGQGGFSQVYECVDPALGRHVAAKVFGDPILQSWKVSWQDREARLLARLDHPGIVRVIEYRAFDLQPFLVMELVAGGASNRLFERGPVSPRIAARLVAGAARALQYAHSMGVLHRDIKPSNMLVVRDFDRNGPIPDDVTLKISDFGLARPLDDDASQASLNRVVGTPAYMSPEQARGETWRIGPASDVYSLGAVLYEFLVARPPLVAGNTLETLRLIDEQEPVGPREIQPGISMDLDTICMKCLRKNPADRYASAGELADDLDRYLQNLPIVARPVPWVDRVLRWCQRNRRLAASLAFSSLLFVLSAVGGVWFGFEQSRLLQIANSAVVEAQNQRRQAEAATRIADANRAMASKDRDIAVTIMDEATSALYTSIMIISSNHGLVANPEARRLRDQISDAFFKIATETNQAESLEREKPEYLCGLLFKTANMRWSLGAKDEGRDLLLRMLDIYSRIPEPKKSLDGLTFQMIAASLMLGDDAMARNEPEAALARWLACWNAIYAKGEPWLRGAHSSRELLMRLGRRLAEFLEKTGRQEELRRIEPQFRRLERIQEELRQPK